MLSHLIIAASALALPEPSVAVFERPHRAFSGAGVAVLEVFVDPDRTVLDCDPIQSTFSEAQTSQACDLLIGRKFEKAAQSETGEALHGVFSLSISRVPPGTELGPEFFKSDMVVQVETLPSKYDGGYSVFVTALVDDEGRVAECETSKDAEEPAFGQAGCAQLMQHSLQIMYGANGEAVQYVRPVQIRFLSDTPSTP